MRIFLAGGTGAVGKRLIPLLKRAGHQVFGTTRTRDKFSLLETLGATPILLDALDEHATLAAVSGIMPEAVIHELTAIPQNLNLRKFDKAFAATNDLRTRGTLHLLKAAEACGVKRFIAQSFGGWTYERTGEMVKSETDPLDPDPPRRLRTALDAIKFLENAVLTAKALDGLVLRYGGFYGIGTALAAEGAMVHAVRKRMVPVIGKGTGVWSFVHIDDAASGTAAAIEQGAAGIYNITDDDPASFSEWLPFLARCAGARSPLHIPEWLGRLIAGDHTVRLMNHNRGASNLKAKQSLGWTPSWPYWKQGFASELLEAARTEKV